MPLSTRRLRAAFGRWPAAPDGTVRADALLSRSALERLGLRADDAAPRARALALALDGDPEAQHDRLCFDDFAAVVRRLEERLSHIERRLQRLEEMRRSPQGQRPPEGQRPPQGRPPQGRPPQGRSPQGRPPQGRPPQGRPPQGQRAPQPERTRPSKAERE